MADDDAPLSALAKAPSRKFDDDTPLASLAAKRDSTGAKKPATAPKAPGAPKAAAGPAAAQGPRTSKAVAKPKGKSLAGAKRKPGNSSSYTDSYSTSSSSDSDDAPLRKKGSRTAPKRAAGGGGAKLTKKKTAENTGDGDDGGGAVRKKERSPKEDLVAQLLSRWWYCEEYIKKDWPPDDESYYEEQLVKNKMRRVMVEEWEWLPELDEQGRRKVYELTQFRGVYRNSSGDLVDLRPKDTCPCYNNFIKKDVATLCRMLISAYENQLEDLKKCRYNSVKVGNDIKVAMTKIRNVAAQAGGLK